MQCANACDHYVYAEQLTAALDMQRTHLALGKLRAEPQQFRDAVRTLLRPAEMLLTVLTTPQATKVELLQEIRPLIEAAAQLYYCEGTAADEVLCVSTDNFEQERYWDRTCTMPELMEKPAQVLRAVDMLIVALSKDLDRCSVGALQLRMEYGSTLVRARTMCWLACIEPTSYAPLVRWLGSWADRMLNSNVIARGVRLDESIAKDLGTAAAAHRIELQTEIERVLLTVV